MLTMTLSVSFISAASVKVHFFRSGGGANGYASVNQIWNDTYSECTVTCRFEGYEKCAFYNPGGLEVIGGIDLNSIADNIWQNNVSPAEGVILCASGQRIIWTLSYINDETELLTLEISND